MYMTLVEVHSTMILIGVHVAMYLVHPNYCHETTLCVCVLQLRLHVGMYIVLVYCIIMTKFSLNKNFAKLSYLCIAEIFGGINFRRQTGLSLQHQPYYSGKTNSCDPHSLFKSIGKHYYGDYQILV